MGHRDLLVTHNLSDGERHDCRPHPRGSVRRTSGFVLTAHPDTTELAKSGRRSGPNLASHFPEARLWNTTGSCWGRRLGLWVRNSSGRVRRFWAGNPKPGCAPDSL